MEIPQWILGALGGGFITALGIAFRFGGVFTKTEIAITNLNKLIEDHKKEHKENLEEVHKKYQKHEEKNDVQIAALWKVVDIQGKQIIVLEHECKNLKEDLMEIKNENS